MFRAVFICLILIVFGNFVFAQIDADIHKPRTAAQANLKGRVHTISVFVQNMKITEGNPSLDERRPLVDAVYDETGRMSSAKFYDDYGQLRRSVSYTYAKDNLTKSDAFFYSPKGQLERLTTYEYDDRSDIVQQTNLDYDEKGVPIKRTILQHSDKGKSTVKTVKPLTPTFKKNLFSSTQTPQVKPNVTIPKKIELKRRFSYEDVDAQGNWTKMTVFGGTKIIEGKKVESREITYRLISYY